MKRLVLVCLLACACAGEDADLVPGIQDADEANPSAQPNRQDPHPGPYEQGNEVGSNGA